MGYNQNLLSLVQRKNYTWLCAENLSPHFSCRKIGCSDTLKIVARIRDKTSKITGTKATAASLSFKWAAVSGASGYKVVYYPSGLSDLSKELTTSTNSCTIKNLKEDGSYAICVYALNSNSDFTAVSNTYTETYATTLPKKIRDFKVTTCLLYTSPSPRD